MSTWSETDADVTAGIRGAFKKIRNAAQDSKAERARQMQRAAQISKTKEELVVAQRELTTRTAVRQDGLEAWPLPGLAPMTRVRTSFGDVPAAALRKGDEVLTRDGRYLRVQWLTRIQLDEAILSTKEDSNPVCFAPGAFGAGAPSSEIMMSPRQIICSDEKNGMNRDREAAMLLSRTGVRRLRETALSYTMFHVGETAEIYCEGLYLRFALDS